MLIQRLFDQLSFGFSGICNSFRFLRIMISKTRRRSEKENGRRMSCSSDLACRSGCVKIFVVEKL